MKFAEFFFKIRDGTEDDGKLFDYEVIVKQKHSQELQWMELFMPLKRLRLIMKKKNLHLG
jgi:hypothetical protein